MRIGLAVLFILGLTIAAGDLRAGLYDPVKPSMPFVGPNGLEPLPYEVFRDRWNDVVIVGIPQPESKFRKAALAAREQLAKLPSPSPADLVRRAELSLRLRDYDACFADLQEVYRQHPRDFWVLTALGTAQQQTGQIAQAVRYLESAREQFAEPWPGPPSEREAAKKCEAAQLKLARLRLREQGNRPGRPRPAEELDALFDVTFDSDDYTAGSISETQKAKLPPDAIAIVQQLLFWLPDDTRLYWQLGELYNAKGDLDSALAVFNECLDSRRFDARLLRRHRQIVKEAIASRPPPPPEPAADWLPDTKQLLVAAAIGVPLLIALVWFQCREIIKRFSAKR